MASIISDPNGLKRIQFYNAQGKRKTIRLGKVSAKTAERSCTHIEELASAAAHNHLADPQTLQWVDGLEDRIHNRLLNVGLARARVKATAGGLIQFVDAYIADRTDAKPRTAINLKRARSFLATFFGEAKELQDVSEGDADEFWRYLTRSTEQKGAGQALNTARRICGRAKQFFRAAQRKRLVQSNPFADVKCQIVANKEREYFVSRVDAVKVLNACPSIEWKLIFALSRWGGLRCPSEHFALKWTDINWTENRFTVHSPKTEHHEGKATRDVPIFPELEPLLLKAMAEAPEGSTYIFESRRQDASANLRTHMHRIIRNAGLEPWPKIFHNLRSTRETELAEKFPIHVVCEWMGNSQAIAKKHYLQTTDDHFAQASGKQNEKAALNAARSVPDHSGQARTTRDKTLRIPAKTAVSAKNAIHRIPPPGLETSNDFPNETEGLDQSGAKCGAIFDDELSEVIAAWPHLSASAKARLLAIVRAERSESQDTQ